MPGFSMDEETPLLGRGGGGEVEVPLLKRVFGGSSRHRTTALVRRRSRRPSVGDAENGNGAAVGGECLGKVLEELEANEGTSRWYIMMGMFCIINHFIGGVISMMFLEGWSLSDAAYFVIVTTTTVGYGDLSPTYVASKLFVIYYVIVSIGIVSSYLAYFIGLFIDQQEELILQQLIEDDSDDPTNLSMQCLDAADYGGMVFSVCLLTFVVTGGALLFSYLEGWSLLDSVYATVISATTVGFGDLHPQHSSTKLCMTIWLVISTISVAKVIADFTEARVKAKQRAVTRRILLARVESASLRQLDSNQDGKVEWGEYLGELLVSTGKITRRELTAFQIKFKQLDIDTDGTLDVTTCR